MSRKRQQAPQARNPVNKVIQAKFQQGLVLHQQGRLVDAEKIYQEILKQNPNYFDALHLLGVIALQTSRVQRGVELIIRAISVNSNIAAAHNNLGRGLSDLQRPEEAMASYDKAIALKPDYADAYSNHGNALNDLKRHEEALASYDKAIALKPDYAEAYNNRGSALRDLKRYDEAFEAYDKALTLMPDMDGVEGARLHSKMQVCNWSNCDEECAHLISSLRKGTLATPPFLFLAIPSSPDEQLQCAKLYSGKKYPTSDKPSWQGERYDHDRIRVAYLSADFREHPVSYLMAGVFEQHDRKRFEIFAISFGPNNPNEMLTRLKGSFEKFIDVKDRSYVDVAKLLRALEIDIAVDLMGYTLDSRTAILAHRPSPIQVNYLGYPGTMGGDYMDYIVADRFVIPELQQRNYTEKIVYLPNSFQANDSKRKIDSRIVSRIDVGLPEGAFVFCSFNNSYKITLTFFDIWMRLLQKIDGSVLWLLGGNTSLERNLRKEAEKRGVNSARLIFAQRVAYSDYLARFRLADLFLDTLPFNAGATASDALWAGLPLITCSGEIFASRMAGSLLTAIGISEMITESTTDYEVLASKLASNHDLMNSIKIKLAGNRYRFPLFNTQLFTKHIEAAYMAMYERFKAGLPFDHIYVPQ